MFNYTIKNIKLLIIFIIILYIYTYIYIYIYIYDVYIYTCYINLVTINNNINYINNIYSRYIRLTFLY